MTRRENEKAGFDREVFYNLANVGKEKNLRECIRKIYKNCTDILNYSKESS